jgi:hypothetical protein
MNHPLSLKPLRHTLHFWDPQCSIVGDDILHPGQIKSSGWRKSAEEELQGFQLRAELTFLTLSCFKAFKRLF